VAGVPIAHHGQAIGEHGVIDHDEMLWHTRTL
jgi:hypothetical protein